MWCPKCKNEYVAGITTCVDCNCELVDDLAAYENSLAVKMAEKLNDFQEESDNAAEQPDTSIETAAAEKLKPMRAYVSKKAKKEDMKSTAYTFTIVGFLGLIALVLLLLDILPFTVAVHMKWMLGVVLGAMFLIFMVIGLRYFKLLKTMGNADEEEEQQLQEVISWFKETYSADKIDEQVSPELSKEQRYFIRYEFMNQAITEQYPDLEESFLDHIIEVIYADIFSE